MKIINLPGELDLDYSDSIIVYDYESTTELSKQQILLSRNTFSFLQEGSKEVFFDNSSYAIDSSRFLLMKSGHCLMTISFRAIRIIIGAFYFSFPTRLFSNSFVNTN